MRIPKIALPLALAAAFAVSAPVAAQEPPRPGLPRGADPNDWQSYFELGDRLFASQPRQAGPAFYWASRLDPTRGEPLFARWASFFAGYDGLFLHYITGDEQVHSRPDVLANDSLIMRAFRRNPFVHRGLEVALFTQIANRLYWDGELGALMEYGEGDFRRAAQRFGRITRDDSPRSLRFRHWRALSFVGAEQPDSAIAEFTELLRTLREGDARRLRYFYESKALHEYALGMLHEAANRPDEARRAFERALEEDFSFYPARASLARLSLRARDMAPAVAQLSEAVQIAPDDPVMQYEYGNALLASGNPQEAITHYQQAIVLEPYFADPYLRLGIALQSAGQNEGAVAAYRAYLERAPRRQTREIEFANQRLAQVQGGS
ncbi:tetratricopeptide repeat protein [Longimicrobium sp.]|uniref:tetratricopeptide repeat protein n=1 Tax=Longimicrobium sp. TaxID=2029185 RepID=UPI002E37EAD4|nr:tetratricopeptide repeat protein [Longimicrobium sp.]HEX6037570.1 tetratricopeptide repeat protein [Longimicrobium sp.]